MKVICDRGALMDAVNLVAAVVPSRTPTPALSCIKLTARKGTAGGKDGGGELVLSGTDAENSLSVTVAHVDVAQPGTVAISADKLRQIVSAEDNEPTLTIDVTGDQCTIKGSNAFFKVYAYPAQDFPAMPDFAAALAGTGADAAKSVFSQSAGALMNLVSRTMFATARETSRYAINGVLLKRDGKKLEMVATDGRRLAVSRAAIGSQAKGESGPQSANMQCIVPTKALSILNKLARDPEEIVRVAVTDSRIYFAFEAPAVDGGKGAKADAAAQRAILSSTLVEGSFPPYEDVIPKDQDKQVVADRDGLNSAVRKASVLTNEESRGVRLSFSKAGKRLTLSSRAPELGESEISVDLASYEGDDIDISFNPTFIADVLRVVTEQQVIIELKASNKPGLIRSSNNDFVYVVMPVTLPQ
jgi:DNA polymerase III subunit beta